MNPDRTGWLLKDPTTTIGYALTLPAAQYAKRFLEAEAGTQGYTILVVGPVRLADFGF